MKPEIEYALRAKCLAYDILEELMKDNCSVSEENLKSAVEYLSRSVHDLVNVYTGMEADHENTLKGTLAKMKVGLNCIQASSVTPTKIKESVG